MDKLSTQPVLYVLDGSGNKVPLTTDNNGYLLVTIAASDVTLNVDQIDIGSVVLQGSVSGNKAEITSGNALKVDGSAVTQPVSLSTIPLATNAATSTAQTSAQTSLSSIDTHTTEIALDTDNLANLDVLLSTRLKPSDTLTKVSTLDTITNPVAVTGAFYPATQPVSGSISFTTTQPVSVSSLPLPSNAAQETGGVLASILTNTSSLLLAQGVSSTSTTGPLVQGLVSDTPSAQLDNTIAPLSVTSEGRLRVSVQQTIPNYFDEPVLPEEFSFGIQSISYF